MRVLLFLSFACLGLAAEPQFGQLGYVEYRPGTLPLVLSMPHGGSLKPESLPSRKLGVVAQDSFTAELAELIAKECQEQLGATPHLIFCHLHRSKLDCNREIKEAAQGNAVAEQTWGEFQGYVKVALNTVEAQQVPGLYIDLHGHRHMEMLVELGYLLKADQLRALEPSMAASSGLKHLAAVSTRSLEQVLRGPESLGALLEARGFGSLPSPSHAAPALEQEYFSGGHNVQTHARAHGERINGLQIECPFKGVRQRPEDRVKFAKALLASLRQWWKLHYGVELAK